MKYIGVADVRNPHADAWGHGGISCHQLPIYRTEYSPMGQKKSVHQESPPDARFMLS
jgi:hypothetical protein